MMFGERLVLVTHNVVYNYNNLPLTYTSQLSSPKTMGSYFIV